MLKRKADNETIENLLASVDALNGSDDIKALLKRFINEKLLTANGAIIVSTHGKHVEIDGTKFSECEATWALTKAVHELISKGISFD